MSASSAILLPHSLSSVAVARQRVSADLQAWGVFPPSVDDAVLVVSELLSNALRHARPLNGGQIKVSWQWTDGVVEVAVSDGGAATEPRVTVPTLSSLGGRGLGIVEHVAMRWGVLRESDTTTTVWALINAPAPHMNGEIPVTLGRPRDIAHAVGE